MRIIPAIDIIDGKCVRLTKGDYDQKKIYNENPLEVAKMFEGAGIRYLHLVDLDGSKAKEIRNAKVLDDIASKTSLKIDFGGGIRSDQDINIAFNAGARQVNLGSVALENKQLYEQWLKKFGSEKIILSADSTNRKIAINGWQEESEVDLFELITEYESLGNKYIVCTDISKDGMLEGIAVDLYKDLMKTFPGQKIIASGGVKDISDVEAAAALKMDGIIIGKAIYEDRITLKQLEKYVD
ncbi:MAG: 1-(5-phosphoribosyl)-5-[(5-phosphoribosylamino)methylideneamino]imidazole-4-carboxamide isomerase [Reichenbachiella sp.]|uniref:1-(5-phosphoribosyl)-5-[(5- phosphoribosylamino)methylideneamino]imidazole-4- carboxamide isomerase n=1 Tax=Reichenbachiella sp. TaxID=2184521 RepID=UPI003264C129